MAVQQREGEKPRRGRGRGRGRNIWPSSTEWTHASDRRHLRRRRRPRSPADTRSLFFCARRHSSDSVSLGALLADFIPRICLPFSLATTLSPCEVASSTSFLQLSLRFSCRRAVQPLSSQRRLRHGAAQEPPPAAQKGRADSVWRTQNWTPP